MIHYRRWSLALLCVFSGMVSSTRAADAPDFQKDVLPVFRKYCNGCHNASDREAGLVLEDYRRSLAGTAEGTVIQPGDSAKSKLWQVIAGQAEPQMPPEDAPQLPDAAKALIKAWIDAGAKAPAGGDAMAGLVTPHVPVTGPVREPVAALAVDPQGRFLAVARPNGVEILTAADRNPVTVLNGHSGAVADARFSATGDRLIVAAGEPGLFGEATVWSTADWTRQRVINGHRDALYAASFSPDGTLIATASYDREGRIWDAANGEPKVDILGHNDAIYGLSFHPSGKWLATASGDRTVKLWDVATGERLDTFSQPAKEQYHVTFSPDGKTVAAGGVDNRIRIWDISSAVKEGTNPIRVARFAHEGPILRVAFSPDGRLLVSCSEERRVKIWETRTFTQVAMLERQPDWPGAVAFSADGKTLFIGRMDGSLGHYDVNPKWADSVTNLVPIDEVPAVTLRTPVAAEGEVAEVEPNDRPEAAQAVPGASLIAGRLQSTTGDADQDLYRFDAKAGEVWMLETNAGRSQSPADTKLEVLHASGEPVRRALLQAVRDSWINFRPIDSTQLQVRVEYWEEMDLNQFLYMNGEIGKFYRAPRGPDSGYDFYENRGKRRAYFDTTPMTHAKDQPVYVVEAYAPDAPIVDNGLPVFPLNYVNDDDAEREIGTDSRLTFTAPADGTYLVRVTDARGFSGENFTYKLALRRPNPDFSVQLDTKNAKVPAGAGQRLKFHVDRSDNFNGPIDIAIANLPAGYQVASPTSIEAGQLEAFSVITAAADAQPAPKEAWDAVKITATAQIGSEVVTKEMGNLGEVTLEKAPSIRVVLIPDTQSTTHADGGLVLQPGTTITAMIRVERNGYDGEIRFDVDNLPHGVIVDNIGLSGVLVRANETERQIFLTARPWVPASTRWIHAVAQGQGNVATAAIPLHIPATEQVAAGQ